MDAPAQRWIAKGKQVAFRLSASESGTPGFATPQWVKRAGAKGHYFQPGKGVVADSTMWEPDFDDPIFLAKLDRFLAAAAARYDGNPEVAFIDVRLVRRVGRGPHRLEHEPAYTEPTVRRHVDLYRRRFKRTLLVANDDFANHGRGAGTIDYARQRGLTLRDDSIMVECGDKAYKSAGMAEPFWMRLPVILESEHYGPPLKRGCWGNGSKYVEAVEAYHASYASIHWWPREFLESNRNLIDRMNRRLGYRLQVASAARPVESKAGENVAFAYRVRNAGFAPCYPSGYVAFTLKDADGGIVALAADQAFDVRSLAVAPPGQAEEALREVRFRIPANARPGAYQVFVCVGTRSGTPKNALPLADDDGQRRYLLGVLKVGR